MRLMRPRLHRSDVQLRSRRAVSPRSCRRRPSFMMLHNDWIIIKLIMAKSNSVCHMPHGRTGADSRATKRSPKSPERREAALRLRSRLPAHHDPVDAPVQSAGSGLSSNAPTSEKDTSSRHPGTAGNDLTCWKSTIDAIVPAFFQIAAPNKTPDKNDGEQGAIQNEIRGCKAEIQGCRTEIRSCREDVNACVGEIKKVNDRISNFEKKVEVSFSTVAGTLSKQDARFRDMNEWIGRSQKKINDRFKVYDERSNILISAAELREQAESLENIKVQLLKFSEIGALEAEIRRIYGEVEANSRSVTEMEGALAKERTIRGNVETHIQHLVSATLLL